MDLEREMSVCHLKGRAEKPVSGIAKRTLRLAQLHGDEPGRLFTLPVPVPESPSGWWCSVGITELLALVITADVGVGTCDV